MSRKSHEQSVANNRRSGLQTHSKWLLSFGLALALAFSGSAWAVHDLFANIELDGNTVNDGVSVPGEDDWDDVYADCQADPDCTPNQSTALRQAFVVDGGEAFDDYSVFKAGKDILPLSDWSCELSTPQGKGDIQHAYGATYVEPNDGDLVFYGGGDRLTVNGSANVGLWLLQQPISCDSEANGGAVTPFVGTHVDGDLFLVSQFEQGGTLSVINVYKWTDPDGIPQNGDECVGNGIDCTAPNEGEPFATGVNCRDSASGDLVCGITNDATVGIIDAAWRPNLPEQGFFEVGVNLTQLIEGIGCFATAMFETRSSTRLNADIKDYVLLDLSTCGSLEVVKETVGGTGTFGFEVDPTAGGPDTFDLTGGQSVVFPNVNPDTYTISESTLPAGPAAPNGWNLTDISCVGGTPAAPTIPGVGHDGGSIDVEVGLSDDVVCTFTNTFTAPPGAITIEKVCDPTVSPSPPTFTFNLTGFGSSDTADCADGQVELSCGSSVTCEGIDADTPFTITEAADPAGWDLTDVLCVPQGAGTSCTPTLGSRQAAGTLADGGSVTATFENTKLATITIRKATVPASVGGDFGFTGDLGPFALADGGSQVFSDQTPGVSVDVTETAKAGYTLDNVTCTGASDWSYDDAGTLTVTPAAGETADCTFTNIQDPGFIQVCKVTVPDTSTQPFEFDLTGPGDFAASTSLINGECDWGSVNLPAGSGYAVSEEQLQGWAPYEVSCVGGAGPEVPSNIDLAPGESVTCTFTNRYVEPPPPAPPAVAVPINSKWALALLVLLTLGAGLFGYRRFS